MAREEDTGKSKAELADRLWQLVEKAKVALLTTWDGHAQAMRPMSGTAKREENAILFLAAHDSPPVIQIAEFPVVTLGYVDGNKYVTVTGQAHAIDDRAAIRDLWSPFMKAWWESAEDPSIRLIRVTVEHGELWDGPNALVAGALMLTAAVTGAKPKLGDHAKVAL